MPLLVPEPCGGPAPHSAGCGPPVPRPPAPCCPSDSVNVLQRLSSSFHPVTPLGPEREREGQKDREPYADRERRGMRQTQRCSGTGGDRDREHSPTGRPGSRVALVWAQVPRTVRKSIRARCPEAASVTARLPGLCAASAECASLLCCRHLPPGRPRALPRTQEAPGRWGRSRGESLALHKLDAQALNAAPCRHGTRSPRLQAGPQMPRPKSRRVDLLRPTVLQFCDSHRRS